MKIAVESPNSTAFARSSASSRLVEAVERGDRPEHLLAREERVVGDALEDRRRDQVAVARPRARRRSSTVPPSRLPRSIAATISSNWDSLTIGPTSTSGSSGSPTRPRSMRASELLAERVVHRVLRRRCAASRCTSGRPTRTRLRTRPRRRGRGRRRPSRSAGCGRRARAGRACPPSSPRRARRGPVATEPVNEIARTRGSRDERSADRRAAAGQHVQDAGRQLGLGERLGDVQPGQRRLVGELQHDGVAVDQRRRELPDRDRDREVPRRDQRRRRRPGAGGSTPARRSATARSARRPARNASLAA